MIPSCSGRVLNVVFAVLSCSVELDPVANF